MPELALCVEGIVQAILVAAAQKIMRPMVSLAILVLVLGNTSTLAAYRSCVYSCSTARDACVATCVHDHRCITSCLDRRRSCRSSCDVGHPIASACWDKCRHDFARSDGHGNWSPTPESDRCQAACPDN